MLLLFVVIAMSKIPKIESKSQHSFKQTPYKLE